MTELPLWPCRMLSPQMERRRTELLFSKRLKQLGPLWRKGLELGEVNNALGSRWP